MSGDALDVRLPGRHADEWDFFDDVERQLDDDAVRARLERFEAQAAPLLRGAAQAGRLNRVSGSLETEVAVGQAMKALAGAPRTAHPDVTPDASLRRRRGAVCNVC